jgi:hypothetical protein
MLKRINLEFLGFRSGVTEVSILLGYDAALYPRTDTSEYGVYQFFSSNRNFMLFYRIHRKGYDI